MRAKPQNLVQLITIIVIGLILIHPKYANAQANDSAQVFTLANSGYERAHALAFSSDGKYLAVGGLSGIYLYDFQQLSYVDFIETNTWARSLAFLPDSYTLAAGLFDKTIKIWDAPAKKLLSTLDGHQGWVRSISVSADGSLIASASDDNSLRIWNVNTGASVVVIDQDTQGIRAVTLSPDGKLVAGAMDDNAVRVWNVSDGSELYTLTGHSDWVRCLTFSPDGQLLASGAFDKEVLLWNMADGSLSNTLIGHTSSVLGLAFSPDGKFLASSSVDTSARLWNVEDGSFIHIFQGHEDFVYAVAFSPDGKTLVSGGGDNKIRLWNLENLQKTAYEFDTRAHTTPSDCRVCHHRRFTIEPARVIEMSCEACHTEGASLAWCPEFPRGGSTKSSPIFYNEVQEVSGVPVNNRDVAVVISSPSNGETLYVRGDYMVPERITGKVFYADQETITRVKVQLDIESGGQKTDSLITYPSNTGEFSFDVSINPGSLEAQAQIFQCFGCHENTYSKVGLPKGEVRIIVTVTTPENDQATDERWFRVDSSGESAFAVHVVDDITGEKIPDLLVEASTVIYDWRSRTINSITDEMGIAHFNLESLSQASTFYSIKIPSQIVNGQLYSGGDIVQLKLKPGESSFSTKKLTAHSQSGSIRGNLAGIDLPTGFNWLNFWAFRLPMGPVYQVPLDKNQEFVFEELPIDQYLVFADPYALAKVGLNAGVENIDLVHSPKTLISLPLTNSQPLFGKIETRNGLSLPFAWVSGNVDTTVIPINPISGEYLILDLPADTSFVTVSAPGYYSQSKSIDKGQNGLDFQLVPKPKTEFISWGNGSVTLPIETNATVNGLGIDFKSGWLWGSGGTTHPLQIHQQGFDVSIFQGEFALERLPDETTWLYMYQGEAQVAYSSGETPITLNGGDMMALEVGANPISMDKAVITAVHPTLNKAPVSETIEPSFLAILEDRLVKAGIKAAQITTIITYGFLLTALIGIPGFALFLRKKK